MNYLDIQPAPENMPTFGEAFRRRPASETRVTLEAGISPCGPALMANHLSDRLEGIDSLTLDVAMRDPAVPDTGLNDILAYLAEPAMHWRNGRWRKASLSSLHRRNPCEGFSGAAAPAYMPEVDEFARPRHRTCWIVSILRHRRAPGDLLPDLPGSDLHYEGDW